MKNEYWKDGAKLIDLKDGLVLIVRTDSGYDNAELVSPGYDEDVEIGIGDICVFNECYAYWYPYSERLEQLILNHKLDKTFRKLLIREKKA